MIMNMQTEEMLMSLPQVAEGDWYLALDTAGQAPLDIIEPADQLVHRAPACTVQPRSIVVFEHR